MSHRYFKHPELDGSPFTIEAGEPAVLLIHGFTATTSEVRPLGKHLHSKGLTVSAPLLAGHGTHPDDLNASRWQDWYESAEKSFLDLRREHAKVWVAGESMGGLLALMLAAKYPEINGLLLFAPALKANLVWSAPFLKHFMKYIHKGKGDPNLAWSGYNVYPTRAMEQLLALQKVAQSCLKQVTQPALIVMSKQDRSVPFKTTSRQLMRDINSTDKKLVVLEDSPHVILLANRQQEAQTAAWRFLSQRISASQTVNRY